jgi:EAL domain-containing protein (putative c-di-GMP-specific phosphodiesterase class I)
VLGLTTVVEGVEDAETAARVREYGCDVGQGFYFSRPVNSEELLELLRRQVSASAK